MALDLIQPNFGGLASVAGTTNRLDLAQANYAPILQGVDAGVQAQLERSKLNLQAALAAPRGGTVSSGGAGGSGGGGGVRLASPQEPVITPDQKLEQMQKELKLKQGIEQQNAEKQNQLDIQKAQAIQDIKTKAELPAENLEKRGTLGASYIIAQQNASSDQERQQIKDLFVKQAAGSGLYKDDELDNFTKASPKDLYQLSMTDVIHSKAAQELLKTKEGASNLSYGKPAEGGTTAGGFTVTTPNGTTINYAGDQPTLGVEKAVKDDVQNSGIQANKNLENLKALGQQYQENFLGGSAYIKDKYLTGKQWIEKIPVLGSILGEASQKEEKWLEDKHNFSTISNYMALDIIKQLSGVQYSDKQLEFLKRIIPDENDTKSVWKGKFTALTGIMERAKTIADDLMTKGYKPGSEEYKNRYIQELHNQTLDASIKAMQGGVYKAPNGVEFTQSQIDARAQKEGISSDEVIKKYGLKGD